MTIILDQQERQVKQENFELSVSNSKWNFSFFLFELLAQSLI